MKYLCVDHGDVRIGLAVSDETGTLARPLTIIKHISRPSDVSRVLALAEEEDCGALVVGLPLDSEGKIGPRARSVMRFVELLRESCTLAVHTWDESNSSYDVNGLMHLNSVSRKRCREAQDDRVASYILQDFLDHSILRNTAEDEKI